MNTEAKKQIGQIIKDNRKLRELTQQALADECNMSRTYLADIESGRYSPSAVILAVIFNALDIDLNLLKNVVNTSSEFGKR